MRRSSCIFQWPTTMSKFSSRAEVQHGNGVVVQGSPGTGKTHTIADIISHYLAQSLRVLVTSREESALNGVIGKLPERIRPLCVGLLSNENDDMK